MQSTGMRTYGTSPTEAYNIGDAGMNPSAWKRGWSRSLPYIAAGLVISSFLLAFGYFIKPSSNQLIHPLKWPNPSLLFYHVYIIRHAEMKYQPIHKCSPPQDPPLPASIGYCKDWGDNRCGGDYLIEQGHMRTRCIVETFPFDGLNKMYSST